MLKAGKSKAITYSKEKTTFLRMAGHIRKSRPLSLAYFCGKREALEGRVQGTWDSLSLSSWHGIQGTTVLWTLPQEGENDP